MKNILLHGSGRAGYLTFLALIGVLLSGLGQSALAELQVADFHGEGSGMTDEFEVKGPWLLDWRVSGALSNALGIEVTLVGSELLNHEGTVVQTHRSGRGTKLFTDSGRYRFRVNSSLAGWRLRVSKISAGEAAAMKRLR